MIVVTGATGQLGREVVEALARRIPPERIAVSVRDPSKAAALSHRGVRVRRGDFADAQSLRHAFEGATQVLLISSNARATGGDPLAQHQNAIAAARDAGAGRIVYTSHMAASDTSAFPPMRDHFATERMLIDSGLPHTILRNGFYASSGIAMLGDAVHTGVLSVPKDGPVAWTAHADLAEAAAIVLLNDGMFDGATPPLTGAELLDLEQVAALAALSRGTSIRRDTIADDVLLTQFAARGVPDRAAAVVLGFYLASRNGEFGPVDPMLERLLGRPPVAVKDLFARTNPES